MTGKKERMRTEPGLRRKSLKMLSATSLSCQSCCPNNNNNNRPVTLMQGLQVLQQKDVAS